MRTKEALTRDEVEAVLEEVSATTYQRARDEHCAVRNAAIVCLMWRTGMRSNEVLSIEDKDIDGCNCELMVAHGKGGKQRKLGLDSLSCQYLNDWLRLRAELGLQGQVFTTLAGKKLSQSYLRNLWPKLRQRAGLDKRLHSHGLRYTFATQLAREVPVQIVQRCLGHTNLNTTQQYLVVDNQEACDLMKGRA